MTDAPQTGAEARIRLFVEADLAARGTVGLSSEQAHYLRHVMRLDSGDSVLLFNGRDGEWAGRIEGLKRGWCSVALLSRVRPQDEVLDLWLVFAPIKRARLDFLVAKATELGVSALWPVFTRHTSVARVNTERLRANAVEAAEQTERLSVPEIREAVSLERLLADWPAGRRLILCAEAGAARPIAEALRGLASESQESPGTSLGAWAVMTGPEGGFAPAELDGFANLPFVTAVGLGPRILRADTAALAALACFQAILGDGRVRPPLRTA